GHELFVTTSVGIAVFPEDGMDAETLLKNSDRAMYRAKEAGRNNYQFATGVAVEGSVGRLSLERSLHHAFDRQEFVIHYQSMIERILEETGLPPSSLDIEITESTAMDNAEMSLAIMTRLKQMGIRLSIDDFGTGYSSLSYLKKFPIDTVKIDQNFVRDLTASPNDGAIISAVISMARALNLRVVAEGVETEEQLEFLRRQHCETIQG